MCCRDCLCTVLEEYRSEVQIPQNNPLVHTQFASLTSFFTSSMLCVEDHFGYPLVKIIQTPEMVSKIKPVVFTLTVLMARLVLCCSKKKKKHYARFYACKHQNKVRCSTDTLHLKAWLIQRIHLLVKQPKPLFQSFLILGRKYHVFRVIYWQKYCNIVFIFIVSMFS